MFWKLQGKSLKTQLALTFIPLAVIPALCLSYYATHLFVETSQEALARRAASERDALVAEIDSYEREMIAHAHRLARDRRMWESVAHRDRTAVDAEVGGLAANQRVRVFSPDGVFLFEKSGMTAAANASVPYLPKEVLRRVRAKGETIDRHFVKEAGGFVTLARVLLYDKLRVFGVLEEELRFGTTELTELKVRRQVDIVFFDRELRAQGASFAVNPDVVQKTSQKLFTAKPGEAVVVDLGDSRYASFLSDLPATPMKNRKWGFVALFLSMTSLDATVTRLKVGIVYLTLLLGLVTAFLVFFLSNRLVRPIEMLVLGMKSLKSGRSEEIPPMESAHEIEYLVQSFNEMSASLGRSKAALEQKVDELNAANTSIKDAQGALVQSAKMVSLGQIVAGVAHELNNPIGFIFSNMHHLMEYVERLRVLHGTYRAEMPKMPAAVREKLEAKEKEVEVDYVLQDMEELTKSCVDGAKRVKEIVLGLRTFSRMDGSTFQPSDLEDGIRSTLKLLVSELKDRIQVHEDYAGLPRVECNLSQMNQVFMNLLSNAAHAIHESKTGRGEIWIRTRREGEFAVVDIEDSGTGMPAAVVDKIFDPFFTTKKVGQGTGLGLSIAYGLVEKHGGQIQVSSELGRGTRFVIRLPIRQPTPAVRRA